ncbi:DUF3867 domain-containing protein [Clostridium tarantellae]|uniref:DUF3867 domain-containing protein n=1 Tax=Clostridium tarantellae TaxID=39493 RepID=A0A6I1MLI3_9CLOT|nr:DUF3867 domain-containing protein [Clostridium tarantellae]MPQ43854.1 DUF3867 domain-containing protein [Clostridium tarantellae]
MDDRVVDFSELKNKARDKDIDKFESYMYDLYFSLAQGQLSMAEFTKNIMSYMEKNNISQEKFFNIQKEMLKRYGMDMGDIEEKMKNLGIKMPPINTETDYEKLRKNLSFQEKYKDRLNTRNVSKYYIKNDLNDVEIILDDIKVILQSTKKINLQDVELNEFLCSYKKTIENKMLNISICENVSIYDY